VAQHQGEIANLAHAYRVLDVPWDASPRAIKASYRKLVKRWHPDLRSIQTSRRYRERHENSHDFRHARRPWCFFFATTVRRYTLWTDDLHPIPLVGLPCTQGNVPLNPNAFFAEIDSGNSATLTFNSTASAVSGWTFYTVPGNLTGFEVLP
jgi:hypothetical protein